MFPPSRTTRGIPSGSEYSALPSHDDKDLEETHSSAVAQLSKKNKKKKNFGHYVFVGVFLVSVFCNFYLYTRKPREHVISMPFPQLVYSPAQDYVEYELRKFTRGVAYEVPIYEQPPSPEVDEAWEGLHKWAGSKIPASTARKLSNATWSIPGEEGWWLTTLDVFHVLHCLDVVRKVTHPADYPKMQHLSKKHVRHCIGAIRQSIMCSSDITPVVWQWNETLGVGDQRDDVVHTCRKFDRIQEWGEKHFYSNMLDLQTHVEWDINAPDKHRDT